MSNRKVMDLMLINKILEKVDAPHGLNSVYYSEQTEFENGELVSLDISDLGITKLPRDLFVGLTKIKKLHASFNSIESLEKETLAPLVDLEFLNLYGNNIGKVDDETFEKNEKIYWLDLRSNEIETLPKSIGGLKNLDYLFLQNNPLSSHQDYDWASDFHSKREIGKFMPEFQEAMGLEVTMKKSLSRQEIAERELRKREAKKKKENSE